MSTSSKITNLLNRKPLTINELAVVLGISRNSAHQQVSKLEAAGAIIKLEQRRPEGAGKPAYQYRTASGKEDIHSAAYKPVLEMLIQTISENLPAEERIALLENAGRSMATAARLHPTGDESQDLQKSVDVVNSLGAMAEIHQIDNKHHISCYSCPVASLVHREPLTCRLVAAFFTQASGKKVSIHCQKENTVVCGFTLE